MYIFINKIGIHFLHIAHNEQVNVIIVLPTNWKWGETLSQGTIRQTTLFKRNFQKISFFYLSVILY